MNALDWLHLSNLELRTGIMGLAEVRDGPSGGMLVVRLPAGTFRPCIGVAQVGDAGAAVASLRVIHESALGGWGNRVDPGSLERGGVIGWLSSDLGTAGVFDHGMLQELSGKDPEGYRAWREKFYDGMDWPYGFTPFGGDSRASVFYVHGSEGQGRFPVSELLDEGEAVGIEIAFVPQSVGSADMDQTLTIEVLTPAARPTERV